MSAAPFAVAFSVLAFVVPDGFGMHLCVYLAGFFAAGWAAE